MRRVFIIIVTTMLVVFSANAEKPLPVISIDGCVPSKMVTSITYDQDKIVLTWNDNTVMSGQLSRLISDILSSDGLTNANIYSVNGIYAHKIHIRGLQKEYPLIVYALNGRIMERVELTSDICSLDISSLPTGVYVLRNNTSLVKFVKM